MKIILLIIYLISTSIISAQQTQFIEYYGEGCVEMGLSVLNSDDGGYILTGFTEDYNAAIQDIIVIKTDSIGQVLWQEIYGGNHQDFGQYMEGQITMYPLNLILPITAILSLQAKLTATDLVEKMHILFR